MPSLLWTLRGGKFVDCNKNAEHLFKLDRSSLLKLSPLELSPQLQPDGSRSDEGSQIIMEQVLRGDTPSFEWVHRDAQGNDIPCEVQLVQLPSSQHRRLIRGSMTDISQRKLAEASLRESEKRMQLAFEISNDGLYDWNVQTGEIFFAHRWYETLGYQPGELELHVSSWEKLVHPDDKPHVMKALKDHLQGKTPVFECENRLRMKSGEYRWNLDRGKVVSWDEEGNPVRMVGVDVDITKSKQTEGRLKEANDRLEQLIHLDPLTRLLNRRGLEKQLAIELERARRGGFRLVVLLADCDNFKQINDRHGHAVGDHVLREIASRAQRGLRITDHLARIGGDEFIVILPETRLAEGRQAARRLTAAIDNKPVRVVGGPVRVNISVAMVELPEHVFSVEQLLALADPELREIKEKGRRPDRSRSHAASFRRKLVETLQSTECLRTYYQGVFHLSSGREVARELLTRGDGTLFETPTELFSLCDRHDIHTLADISCLRRCISAVQTSNFHGTFHVNLFPSTLMSTPIDRLLHLLNVEHEGTKDLCVELGEQQFVGNPIALSEQVKALKDAGIRFSLDDVGFGKSSIEALVLLEPEFVKIDRIWITGISKDDAKIRLLQRLKRVVDSLNATLIAEGIESREDLECLGEIGVEYGQGYYWGEPAPVDEPD